MNSYLLALYQLCWTSLELPCHCNLIASLFIYAACQLSMFENYKIYIYFFFWLGLPHPCSIGTSSAVVPDDIPSFVDNGSSWGPSVGVLAALSIFSSSLYVSSVGCSTSDTMGPIGNTAPVTCETRPVCILVLTGTGYNCRWYTLLWCPNTAVIPWYHNTILWVTTWRKHIQYSQMSSPLFYSEPVSKAHFLDFSLAPTALTRSGICMRSSGSSHQNTR